MAIDQLYQHALGLLQQLIATPSFSREEGTTAQIIEAFLQQQGVPAHREGNNVYAFGPGAAPGQPIILLNSHHDTVKPNKGYTRDPFVPTIEADKLYGLGSNDAGGCLVALMATFLHFYRQPNLPFQLVLAASAEEEISGREGIERVLPCLGHIDYAIVGEPTLMQMAVAERGLMVLDAVAPGRPGHAARNEGDNALYNALDDILVLRKLPLPKVSPLLGESKLTATVIETDNKQHNVVPSACRFTIDVRLNELYTFEELLAILEPQLKSSLTPRSMRLRSTSIPMEHPLVQAGLALGKSYYGSPTTSDKALMPFPALKMGPGDSARSHSADEYIWLHEIKQGITGYIAHLEQVARLLGS